ncbi:MAG: DUF4405 domain-containing protein [Flavobacteriaceae bacterium]|nr:DUF4405 domain-containing protein [Flavobacteriaceae bacterium]
MNEKKMKFSWKAFISLSLTYFFIIMLLTGVVLYLTPTGRIAHWSNWTLLGFSKEEWQSIHIIFSLTFAILSIFHLFSINWKVFLAYLKKKNKSGLNKKKEFYLASVFTILIFLGVVFSIPPFNSVINFGDYLTHSWENVDTKPPTPHAELLTLNELSDEYNNLTIKEITNKLNANNIKFNNANETLKEIGELNNLSPIKIYNILTQKTKKTEFTKERKNRELQRNNSSTKNKKNLSTFESVDINNDGEITKTEFADYQTKRRNNIRK